MTIIALAKRFFRRLAAPANDKPIPTFKELATSFAELARRFRHRRRCKLEPDTGCFFLLLGYCPRSSEPSGALIECTAAVDLTFFPLVVGEPWMICEGSKRAESESRELQSRIKKAREQFKQKHGDKLDADVEVARRGHAMNKQLEQEVIDAIDEQFKRSIGGHLDKAELVLVARGVGAADFTHGNVAGNLLSSVPATANGLAYVHLLQKTGR